MDVKEKILQERGWACECCGISYLFKDKGILLPPSAFDLDHVNDDGARERKTWGHKSGERAWKRWRDEGYPPTKRLLCAMCNAMKNRNKGVCPHENY